MKKILFIISFLTTLSACINSSSEKESHINEEESNINKSISFTLIQNSEVNHYVYLPISMLEEVNTSKYDSTIWVGNNLLIKIWTDVNFYPLEDFQLDEFGDIDMEKIDKDSIIKKFTNSCKGDLSIDNLNCKSKNVVGEKIIYKKKSLCDVVGGTFAVRHLIVESSIKNEKIAKEIIKNSGSRNIR